MNAISQRKTGFETRVAKATEKRFDDRPQLMKLNVGDFFEYGVPVVEDAWRFDNGVRVTEQTEDVADPDLDLLGTDYPIRHQHRAWFATFISPEIGSAARVRQFVGRLGFKAYWPRSVRVVRRGKAKKEVVIVSQVYPRYVLVHLPARWEAAKREGTAVVRIADGSPVLEPCSVPFGLLTGHEARFNGLAGLVKFGKEPIWLPDALVERIVRRERAGSFNDTVRSGSKVLPKLPAWCFIGAIVKVVDGPFASFPAVIEALDLAKSRAQVSVNIFGRATPTDLAIADLSDVC